MPSRPPVASGRRLPVRPPGYQEDRPKAESPKAVSQLPFRVADVNTSAR
jgi:hypothetical protein